MPLASVPAIYDGEKIRLLEDPPVMVPYHVLVTFVEPALETPRPRDLERFRQSLGAWQDNRPVEATLDDIYSARHSKSEPPQL